MNSLIKQCGGRKMFVFLLVFLVITVGWFLKLDVGSYAMAVTPFVGMLVIGNLGEHKIKQKSNP